MLHSNSSKTLKFLEPSDEKGDTDLRQGVKEQLSKSAWDMRRDLSNKGDILEAYLPRLRLG